MHASIMYLVSLLGMDVKVLELVFHQEIGRVDGVWHFLIWSCKNTFLNICVWNVLMWVCFWMKMFEGRLCP